VVSGVAGLIEENEYVCRPDFGSSHFTDLKFTDCPWGWGC
jgi:hypothetical protein